MHHPVNPTGCPQCAMVQRTVGFPPGTDTVDHRGGFDIVHQQPGLPRRRAVEMPVLPKYITSGYAPVHHAALRPVASAPRVVHVGSLLRARFDREHETPLLRRMAERDDGRHGHPTDGRHGPSVE